MAWERLRIPQKGLENVAGARGIEDPPEGTRKRCWGEGHLDYFVYYWMDGWMGYNL